MEKKNIRNNKKGFTLIEIIVVLIIVGILIAIAVPSVLGYIGKAEDVKHEANARTGFLAAQTILVKKNSKNQPVTADDFKAGKLNDEANADNVIEAAACKFSGATGEAKISECYIRPDGMEDDRYVKFTTDDEAVVVNGTLTDGDVPLGPSGS